MENSQSVQQQPSEVETPTSKSENSKSQHTSGWNLLIHLLAHRPWLFLIGLLAIFIGGATLSLCSLGYVGFEEQTKPEEQEALEAEVEQPITTPSETTNPTPLWMLAAIALSCGSGCLLIFRVINRPAKSQRFQKQKNRYQARMAQRRRQTSESLPPENSAVILPPQPQTPMMATPAQTKSMVTVLPPQPSLSQDTSNESLASTLDIRKQTSLDAISRKK